MIDKMETANRVAAMTQLVSQNSGILAERAALQRQFTGTFPRESALEEEAARLLAEPLSAAGRQALIGVLIPEWDKGRMRDVLTQVRLTGPSAWLSTLAALTGLGRLPIIDVRNGLPSVSSLRERHQVRKALSPNQRCHWCEEEWLEWAEDIWRGTLHRRCTTCGSDTRTRVALPNPFHQPTLW